MGIFSTTTGKVVAGGILAAGLTFGGITWLGGNHITDIRGNVDNMRSKITQAIEDNEFLKGQFDNLRRLYSSSVQEANGKIDSLVSERNRLMSQVETLKAELAEQSDNKAEKEEEIQSEINRLESELQQANEEVAELAAYTQSVDESIEYTPIDREAYTAKEEVISEIPLPISAEALALNEATAKYMAKPSTVEMLRNSSTAKTAPDIIGVTTAEYSGKTVLAYKTSVQFNQGGYTLSETWKRFATDYSNSYLYFVTEDGRLSVVRGW